MRTQIALSIIAGLVLVAVIGLGLGLLVWRLMSSIGWNRNTVWISNLVWPVLPLLALAWGGNVVVHSILLRSSASRHLAAQWLLITLAVWLCATLINVGVLHSYGTAYPYGTVTPTFADLVRLVAGSGYIAAGLSFGFVLGPLLAFRACSYAWRRLLGHRLRREVE